MINLTPQQQALLGKLLKEEFECCDISGESELLELAEALNLTDLQEFMINYINSRNL
jgi:hypothetical protein